MNDAGNRSGILVLGAAQLCCGPYTLKKTDAHIFAQKLNGASSSEAALSLLQNLPFDRATEEFRHVIAGAARPTDHC